MTLTSGQADVIAKAIVTGLKGKSYSIQDIDLILSFISSNITEEKNKLEL